MLFASPCSEAFKINDDDFFVPELHAWLGALGAAMFESPKLAQALLQAHPSTQAAHRQTVFAGSEPLSMEKVNLFATVSRTPASSARHRIPAYLGIDIGSVSTNLVVIDTAGNLLHEIYLRTQGRPVEVVQRVLRKSKPNDQRLLDIRGVGTTGSGRELIWRTDRSRHRQRRDHRAQNGRLLTCPKSWAWPLSIRSSKSADRIRNSSVSIKASSSTSP